MTATRRSLTNAKVERIPASGIRRFFDLVSGAPQGVHAFVFTLMALFARVLTTRVAVNGIVLGAATSFVASLLSSFLIVIS